MKTIKELDKFQTLQNDWAIETFPKSNLNSKFNHLRDELLEIEMTPNDVSEWADVYILFSQAAKFCGISMSEVIQAAVDKHKVNVNRTWGIPNEQGYVEHIKDDRHSHSEMFNKKCPKSN